MTVLKIVTLRRDQAYLLHPCSFLFIFLQTFSEVTMRPAVLKLRRHLLWMGCCIRTLLKWSHNADLLFTLIYLFIATAVSCFSTQINVLHEAMFPVPKEGVGPRRSFVNVPPSATPSHYLFNSNLLSIALCHQREVC